MKVSIKGRMDFGRMWSEIKRLTEWLDSHGIKEVRSLNIYFTPLNEDGEEVEVMNSETGFPIIGYEVQAPTKKVSSKRKAGKVIPFKPGNQSKEVGGQP